jgi:hypothetical protein
METTQVLGQSERRWNWRTWNLLWQIEQATDGEDARQKSGEMTERGLCIALTPEMRALKRRGWAEVCDHGELFDDGGNSRILPVWRVTVAGRQALEAAERAGVTIR